MAFFSQASIALLKFHSIVTIRLIAKPYSAEAPCAVTFATPHLTVDFTAV